MRKVFKRGNLRLVLDQSEVFPDDPGNGCPSLVQWVDHWGDPKFSASYNCAINEERLDSSKFGEKELTSKQIEWLSSLDDKATQFLYGVNRDGTRTN